MSVLDRSALEASPLADLHAVASELSIDGYRRLRRAELIDAILNRQEGGDADDAAAETPDAEPVTEAPARRSRRSRKAPEPDAETEAETEPERSPSPSGRGRGRD